MMDNSGPVFGQTCEEYINQEHAKRLEDAVDGGLKSALLREGGRPVEVMAKFIASCLLADDLDPLHMGWFEFQELFSQNLQNMGEDINNDARNRHDCS